MIRSPITWIIAFVTIALLVLTSLAPWIAVLALVAWLCGLVQGVLASYIARRLR